MWRVLSRVLYPAIVVGALLTAAALQALTGWSIAIAGALVIVSTAMLIWALEWLRPYQKSWQPARDRLGLDVLHTGISASLGPLIKAGLLFGIAQAMHPQLSLQLWPSHLPIWAQLLIALPLADLGIYLGHRLMHSTELGWRVHAVHHSSQGLHFWAAARTHPFNVVVKLLAESGPLLLLGIEPHVYGLWLVLMTVNGLLQHANIDLRPIWLSRVLTTNLSHRVHHAHAIELENSNYGNTTMIWDQLFGTFQMPPEPVTEVGAVGYAIPESYRDHLMSPFVLERFETQE